MTHPSIDRPPSRLEAVPQRPTPQRLATRQLETATSVAPPCDRPTSSSEGREAPRALEIAGTLLAALERGGRILVVGDEGLHDAFARVVVRMVFTQGPKRLPASVLPVRGGRLGTGEVRAGDVVLALTGERASRAFDAQLDLVRRRHADVVQLRGMCKSRFQASLATVRQIDRFVRALCVVKPAETEPEAKKAAA